MKNFVKKEKKSSTIVCHDPCMYFWSPKDFSCVLIFYCNVLNWWAFYTLLLSIAPKNSILWPPWRKVFWYQICSTSSPVSSFFLRKVQTIQVFSTVSPQSLKDLYMIKRFKKHLVPNIILYLYEYLWHFHIKNPFYLYSHFNISIS